MLTKRESAAVDAWLEGNQVYTLVPKEPEPKVYFDRQGCLVLGDGLANNVVDCIAIPVDPAGIEFDIDGVSLEVLAYVTNGDDE